PANTVTERGLPRWGGPRSVSGARCSLPSWVLAGEHDRTALDALRADRDLFEGCSLPSWVLAGEHDRTAPDALRAERDPFEGCSRLGQRVLGDDLSDHPYGQAALLEQR